MGEQKAAPGDLRERRDRVTSHVLRLLGDEARARRWLAQPNPDLRGRAPAELLDSDPGLREIEQLLRRLERLS